ncbi:MAG: glycosyltransferase family 1 protein [Clostridia bacterium]|nr:glycosyltransferase family 1 protein [Clostridia bacterium]
MNRKIAIDALQLSKAAAGVGNYQFRLINELRDFPFDFDVYVSRSGILESSANMNIITVPGIESNRKRLAFQLLRFGKVLKNSGCALVHFLDYMTPLGNIPSKKLVTIHDLSFFTGQPYFTKSATAFKRRQIPRALENSDGIITVSNFTKREIMKYFPKTDSQKITPVHLGVEIKPAEKSALPNGIKPPFVLFVGTVEPRKNITALIKTMEILWDGGETADLVIAGGFGWLYGEIIDCAKRSRHTDKIKFTGFIQKGELEALYSEAEVFAFPSLYEGFGLPPLEAMGRGLAVVSSDKASMPEVLGNAALFADSPAAAAEKIGFLLNNKEEREHRSLLGLARSREFSWRKTAEKTAEIYEKLLSE